MASNTVANGIMSGAVGWALTDRNLWWIGTTTMLLLGLALWISTWSRSHPGFPIVNLEPKKFPYLWPSKHQWAYNTPGVIAKGQAMTSSCFQVRTMAGYKILIPRRFAHELRHNSSLDFRVHTMKDIQAHLPGMDAMKEALRLDGLFAETIRTKFTQSLAVVLLDMVDEGAYAVSMEFGESPEWKTHGIKDPIYFAVSRTATRVYTGKEMARNETWLKLVHEYTLNFFEVMRIMPLWPRVLRPVVHSFTGTSRKLDQKLREAEKILTPIILETKRHRISTDTSGTKKRMKGENAFAWMLDIQNGRQLEIKNLVHAQLGLSLISMQSSTEVLSRALFKLAQNPKLLGDLRKEVICVLQLEGWTKTALYKMELMDSFLREVLRVLPMAFTSLARHVSKEVVLSDGTRIPAGSEIQLVDDGPKDASVYENPHIFDAYRTVRKREEPGERHRHQFVSTTSETLTFGLGEFACPGRFFAAQELKILIAQLVMKYDWEFVGPPPELLIFESVQFFPPSVTLRWRRRVEEIDMANPMNAK